MADEEEQIQSPSSSSSLLDRLFSSTNTDFSLFLPLILGLSPDPDPEPLPRDPTQRDRIVVVNPFTQGTVVIEGSSNVDALLRGIRDDDGHPPASLAAVHALPAVPVVADGGACAICLEEWVAGEGGVVVKEMPCGHRFHVDCVGRWLRIHGSCPICRHLMPVEEEERDPKRIRREIWVSFSLAAAAAAGRRRRSGADPFTLSMDGGDLPFPS